MCALAWLWAAAQEAAATVGACLQVELGMLLPPLGNNHTKEARKVAHLVASWLVAAFSPTPPSCCSSAPYALGTLSAAACGRGSNRQVGHTVIGHAIIARPLLSRCATSLPRRMTST